MDKNAHTSVPIHDLLHRRWSPVAFDDRAVSSDTLTALFEAARWAPSCFNAQPWRFIVATREDAAEYERLLHCLVDKNIEWAQSAPVLALSVARLRFEHNDKPNRHALHDVGLAVENLIVQATALGLYVHVMAGFHRDEAREAYGIPDGFEPVAAIAIGYMGNAESLPEHLRKRQLAERERKPLGELIFSARWGEKPIGLHIDP